MSTGEAARHIGVDRGTLGRWVAAGYGRPTRRTTGGQSRRDLDDLEEQLEAAEHDDASRLFAPVLTHAPRYPEEPR